MVRRRRSGDHLGPDRHCSGVNYYHGELVGATPPAGQTLLKAAPSERPKRSPFPAADGVHWHKRDLPRHGDGLGGAARRSHAAAAADPRRVHRTGRGRPRRHRERRRLRRCRRRRRRRARRRARRPSSRHTSGRSWMRSTAGCPCAATSTGRSWTTSSGRGVTTSDSASCASTTTPRNAPERQRDRPPGDHRRALRCPARGDPFLTTEMTPRRRRRVAPTLETVAAPAGVSRSTVSRVVNGSPR